MAANPNLNLRNWMIEQIKYMITIYQEELNSQKERLGKLVENHISDYQNLINSILAGLGIVVTAATLVTGIKAFNEIENRHVETRAQANH
jgi:Mg2+ and Co2+ transporter CorA